MIKNVLLYLCLVVLSSNCHLSPPSNSSSADANTIFTITNKTSDMDVQVVLGSSRVVVLKKGDCVQSSYGDLAQIQVNFKPSVIQISWLESCKKSTSQCRFDDGAWWTLCQPGKCRQGHAQHYEFKGSSTGKNQQWITTSKRPSSCSSL